MNSAPTISVSPSAAFIIIGNEILSGRTQDKNLAFLAQELGALGIRLKEVRVVLDIEADIIAAVNALRAQYDYVFTSGGIGPTHDDITTASIANAFGVSLYRDAGVVKTLEEYYRHKPEVELNEARLKMADFPIGASLIDNEVTSAPGFQMGNVYVMAGIPNIMQAMFRSVAPHLRRGNKVHAMEVEVLLPEGTIAKDISLLQDCHPGMDVGSYPFTRDGIFGTHIVLRSEDQAQLAKAKQELEAIIIKLGHGKKPAANY